MRLLDNGDGGRIVMAESRAYRHGKVAGEQ